LIIYDINQFITGIKLRTIGKQGIIQVADMYGGFGVAVFLSSVQTVIRAAQIHDGTVLPVETVGNLHLKIGISQMWVEKNN